MTVLRFVLGDQLNRKISSLKGIDRENDTVLMIEAHGEATYVRHHKQKLVLVFSAMRHFAAELQREGLRIRYVTLEDERNRGSLREEVQRAVEDTGAKRIVVTEPGEWRLQKDMEEWADTLGIHVETLPDDRFLCLREDFSRWARARDLLRMEHFYHFMRKKTGWLMDDGRPRGGKWNFDRENRRKIPPGTEAPPVLRFSPDELTRRVMAMVERCFKGHFGDLASFNWAVTREQALMALENFIATRCEKFGDFQDSMKSGEDFLFHSVLSPYMNIGLLSAREVCEAALEAYFEGGAPLNAVEGFIRQILGWREFVRGIYWEKMPSYGRTNFLQAKRPLPWFFWSGETGMQCLAEAIRSTKENAYAHHIQRLMVTGNFCLLAGVRPAEVEEWYLAVYADAFEWVELPNTHGMVLYADGGVLASKPYAASGSYIKRMSDYCRNCRYKPTEKTGAEACPFNYLYWNFLIANEPVLKPNPRMRLVYDTLSKMDAGHRRRILKDSERFLELIGLL